MKHIDQAFLKAYEQLPQAARSPAAEAPKPPTPEKQPVPQAQPVQQPAVQTIAPKKVIKSAPKVSQHVPQGPHRAQPARVGITIQPKAATTSTPDETTKPEPAVPHTPAADTNAAAAVNQSSTKQPAETTAPAEERQRNVVAEAAQSILPAVQPLANIPPASGSQASLSPKQSVATFRWNDLDDTLNEVADAELTHLAVELARRSTSGLKLMLVTSWARAEGRTSLLLCLARHLVDEGLKVAVVDGDFARPGLADRLGLEPERSWTSAVAGEASLSDCAIESEADRLVAFPLAAAGGTWPSGPRLRLVLGLLRRDYDLVLIDGGPLAEGNDPPIGWPQIDASIIVRDPSRTNDEQLLETETELATAGIAVLGIAENFH